MAKDDDGSGSESLHSTDSFSALPKKKQPEDIQPKNNTEAEKIEQSESIDQQDVDEQLRKLITQTRKHAEKSANDLKELKIMFFNQAAAQEDQILANAETTKVLQTEIQQLRQQVEHIQGTAPNYPKEQERPRHKYTIPRYEAKPDERPTKYLKELAKYCQTTRAQTWEYNSIINESLQGTAKEWWSAKNMNIVDLEEFETALKRRFWSTDAQHKIRRELNFGYYKFNNTETRTQHAMRLIGNAKDLEPPMSDKEIIDCLSNHFTQDIRAAIFSRGITSTEDLLDIIDRSDQTGPLNAPRRPNWQYGQSNERRYNNTWQSTTNNNQPDTSHNKPPTPYNNTYNNTTTPYNNTYNNNQQRSNNANYTTQRDTWYNSQRGNGQQNNNRYHLQQHNQNNNQRFANNNNINNEGRGTQNTYRGFTRNSQDTRRINELSMDSQQQDEPQDSPEDTTLHDEQQTPEYTAHEEQGNF